jgi:DNA-binding NarL/FixJ family response regulator
LTGPELFGRDRELEAGRRFLEGDGARGLVIEGAAGIGKTAVWRALLDAARDDGYLVLECIGDSAEARLTFVGLGDLLGESVGEVLPRIPAPQARALEVALLRVDAADSPSDPLAVAAGFLGALHTFAAQGPVLVAVDDVPWLDPASAEVVTFAARRLRAGDVRFLLTRRPRTTSSLERALEPVERLDVGPLSLGAVRRMLVERLGLTLPRHLLRRLYDVTLGNPLFALELGRMLVEQELPALGEDLPVPETVEELLGTRVTRLPASVRMLLLAVSLGGDVESAQLGAIADPAALDEAIDRGLLVTHGSRVRTSHPLFAAAVKRRSKLRERRELHLTLAASVADETLRARHLALAARDPDDELARVVATAARSAFARGARREAVELGEHALRLTPPASAERAERLLALASYLETAGELQRLTDLLTAELESIPPGSLRARAWMLLGAGTDFAHYRWHLEQALKEAEGDPGLHAHVVAFGSSAVIAVERIADAERRTLAVLPAAESAGPEIERAVLYALGWARALRGRDLDEICERWAAASITPGHLGDSPDRIAGQRLLWRGEIAEARAALERLLALSDERGEMVSYFWARLHLCELALRIGDWETARRLLDEWDETGDRQISPGQFYERCLALLEAGRGNVDEATRWSTEAIAQAEAIGYQWDWLEGLRARGMTDLLEGDPGRARESLRAVWEHATREGVDEPGVFPVAPDLVEALLELGDTEDALAVTSRLEALSEQQQHPWGLVTARRCLAVIRLAASAHDDTAAADLEAVASSYGELGLPFDRARSLLSLGRAERRLRKWAAARRSLDQAARAFDELGSTGWAERARSELARISARRPSAAGELTPTERRVVELAAEGRSNKEIAHALFVTVNTVEGHLSHAYAKLGIHSRTQLAHRLHSDEPGSTPTMRLGPGLRVPR